MYNTPLSFLREALVFQTHNSALKKRENQIEQLGASNGAKKLLVLANIADYRIKFVPEFPVSEIAYRAKVCA